MRKKNIRLDHKSNLQGEHVKIIRDGSKNTDLDAKIDPTKVAQIIQWKLSLAGGLSLGPVFIGQQESQQWKCGQAWEDDQLSGIGNGNINRLYSSKRSKQTRGELIKRPLTGLEVGWNQLSVSTVDKAESIT